MEKKSKKKYLIGALAVLLVAVAVGGTIAWLTAANKVTNSFTVGEITPPEEKPGEEYPDPDPDDPDGNPAQFNGNIYEVYRDGSEVYPGASVQKMPFIGVGKDSKPAYVFAYVSNSMMVDGVDAAHMPYFTLNDGWAPVSGSATEYTGVGASDKTYVSGLFVLGTASGGSIIPNVLTPNGTADVWSSYIFNTVEVPEVAVASDFASDPQMDVWCYLYAAVDDATYQGAEDAAKAWSTSGDGLQVIQGTATPAQP